MFDALTAALFPSRRTSMSVPVLDGALKPNNLLEEAAIVIERPGLEDLALDAGGTLYAACGSAVLRITSGGEAMVAANFDRTVTAMAFLTDGTLAVGFGDRVVLDALGAAAPTIETVDGAALSAVTALSAGAGGSLLICDGSAGCPCADWSRDLLEAGCSGRLLHYDGASRTARTLASGLAYAFGVMVDATGRALVCESWAHRVSAALDGRTTPVIAGLPAYPARFAPAPDGGFWLTMFACRTQLVQFVLRETDYRREMMRTIAPEYWVAPAFSSGADFLEPLQGGGVKQMGILKPWAPSRSYGLVVRYGADLRPLYSLHSRAGGHHHGIVAAAQRGGDLFVLSKGAGRILRLAVPSFSQPGHAEPSP
jgi:sugar lactone lactonase YvrE